MKKLFLSLAVVFSVAMVSCGGNKANEENADTMEAPQVEEVAVVEAQVDTNAAPGDTTVNVEAEGAAAETPAEPAQ